MSDRLTPELSQSIASLIPKLHGWCGCSKALCLASTVIAIRPDICIEIGVWGGRSLIPMALACKEVGHGIVWGIDPWKNADSVKGQPKDHADWWGKIDHNIVYNDYMKHVRELGLEKLVRTIRKRSDEVTPPESFDLLHCDGNHGEQAIRDIERFAPKIRVGGIAVLDDIGWPGGAVTSAAKKLEEMGFMQLYRVFNKPTADDDWAVYQRVKT